MKRHSGRAHPGVYHETNSIRAEQNGLVAQGGDKSIFVPIDMKASPILVTYTYQIVHVGGTWDWRL
jgi:hypothetical protein